MMSFKASFKGPKGTHAMSGKALNRIMTREGLLADSVDARLDHERSEHQVTCQKVP